MKAMLRFFSAFLVAILVHGVLLAAWIVPPPPILPPPSPAEAAAGVEIDLQTLPEPVVAAPTPPPEPVVVAPTPPPEPVVAAPPPIPIPKPVRVAPKKPDPKPKVVQKPRRERPKPEPQRVESPRPSTSVRSAAVSRPNAPVVPTTARPNPKPITSPQPAPPTASKPTAPPRPSAPPVDVGALRGSYGRSLAGWLNRHKQYPQAARNRGQQGVAKVRVTVDRQGHMVRYDVIQHTGHPLLDAEVQALIQRAKPLPAFPAGLEMAQMSVVIPIAFQLR